jgi:uncharacterized protein (DUF2062 family)
MKRAIEMCLAFYVCSLLLSISTAFIVNPIFFIPLFWLSMFFGAMTIPPASGN